MDLTDRVEAHPPELSGGERQRAALARAVILSPEVILADEPTGRVDREMALRLLTLLVELNRMGKTVLVATHDPELIRAARTRRRRGCCASGRPACSGRGRSVRRRAAGCAATARPTGWCRAGGTLGAARSALLAAVLGFFAVLSLALALAAGRLAEAWAGELAETPRS